MQKDSTYFHLFFWLITQIIAWLLIGCLSCIVFAILIVAIHGEKAGIAQLQNLLRQDYNYITLMTNTKVIVMINQKLQIVPRPLSSTNLSIPVANQAFQKYLFARLIPFANAVLLGIKILIIRLYLLFHWSHLLLLLGFVGFVDGITQRYIRRKSAGRESALIYHHAKALIMLGLILGIFANLVFPISIQYSKWIFMIAALFVALAIQITTKSFKKYI